MVKKYVKKPIVIEAIQLVKYNLQDCYDFLGIKNGNYAENKKGIDIKDGFFKIDTLEGTMRVNMNDFIIKGVQGEFYPCKPDIFNQTYEEYES